MKLFTILLLFVFSLVAAAQPYEIGNIATTFVDPDRGNRNIPTQIFYPAATAGSNVPAAEGMFPVVVFGHGFVMGYFSYQFLWEALVPEGYILVLPTTEGGFSPSHLNLALDMAFLIETLKAEGFDSNSVFYGRVASNAAMMGHSMGGGAAFLGSADNPSVTALVTFAAAETNPSAIAAAASVQASSIVFAGENDCVTPPSQHQVPMYNALQNEKKSYISINGGGHCLFNNYNFACAIGEGSCSPNPTITREEQQQIVLSLLIPFFEFQLKGDYSSWLAYNDLLYSSADIVFEDGWTTPPQLVQTDFGEGWNSFSYPLNPVDNTFKLQFYALNQHIQSFTNFEDISFSGDDIPENFFIAPNEGYILKLSQEAMLQYAGYEHEDKSFTLTQGWSLMPVLSAVPVDPDQLYSQHTDALVMIKEVAGSAIYWPEFGIQSLGALLPARAYWVNVNSEVTIEFD